MIQDINVKITCKHVQNVPAQYRLELVSTFLNKVMFLQ